MSDETQVAQLLSTVSGRPAPPDEVLLSRLREESTRTFIESAAPSSVNLKRTDPMTIVRVLAGLAVAAAALAIFFNLVSGPTTYAPLREFSKAQSLRLKLFSDGEEREVLVKPHMGVRINDASTEYVVFTGKAVFEVIEAENQARPFDDEHSPLPAVIDLLGRVHEIGTRFRWQKQEARTFENELCDVYAADVSFATESDPWRIESFVSIESQKLRYLLLTPPAKGGPSPAQLTVQAVNEPLDDAQFTVSDTLTEDGRIGKFVDVQGLVSLRPKTFTRWTPVCAPGGILRPGDWVRTDVRGANAVAIQLVPETKLTLGPGSLVEVLKPMQVKVLSGEFEFAADEKHPIELTGPDGTKLTISSTQQFRTQGDKLVKLEKEPLWLAGFKGTTPQETLGSLIAKVDGRNVPLHIGYHKVSVEIRDQIARTTVEESFVNSTDSVLEGQFHFPLPQDASISGFGMWVGDRLVEADIVEKQRAREIYETILREKRDPGLLEWTGGNIFKARVYPIPAHGEKRIKIVYTQVLPREGASYRYSYALQSELLRQHPVRELNLSVTVSSAVPLKAVTCPTHPSRNQQTQHSARVEFSAQEYSPTKDFEVVIQVEDRADGVVMIPHRRGEDGYFMLLLQPPDGGQWQRDVVPDSEPLKVIVLADTSASMDRNSRKIQDEVLGALLSTLGPKDTFELAACDVDCVWATDKPQSPEMKNIESARSFLAKRRSMGWTDLDKAFAEALRKCGAKTHVVYLGDGILTTGDADGVAFAKRLVEMAKGKPCSFHSVAVSSSFEPAVLKTMASVGGGSFRPVSGEKGPQQTARDLVKEIAQPALKNVMVKFVGLRTARVYPATLTNLPLGTQQIVLGRYLPEGTDQKGEVVVTGMLGDKEVSYRTAVTLKDAERGNSFIPRLWARMHLDELLAQGTSQTVQDEIINLSEEYHLMTPYTSLLVLESDADRERFKVKRRFQMQDGERFFADARDKAQYELVQQQMRLAGLWRIGLWQQALSQFATLGRSAELFDTLREEELRKRELAPRLALLDESLGFYDRQAGDYGGVPGVGFPGGGGSFAGVGGGSRATFLGRGEGGDVWISGGDMGDAIQMWDASNKDKKLSPDFQHFGSPDRFDKVDDPSEVAAAERLMQVPYARAPSGGNEGFEGFMSAAYEPGRPLGGLDFAPVNGPMPYDAEEVIGYGLAAKARFSRRKKLAIISEFESRYLARESARLPFLIPITLPEQFRTPKPAAEILAKQTKEIRDLVLALSREEKSRALAGGIVITRDVQSFEPRYNELATKNIYRDYLSDKLGWLTFSEMEGGTPDIQWCDKEQRGIWSPAYELALVRKATKDEAGIWPRDLEDYPLAAALIDRDVDEVKIERGADGQVVLALKIEAVDGEQSYESRFTIDTNRQVLLSVEERRDGKLSHTTKFSDFVEVAGRFWPQTTEHLDKDNRRTSLTKSKVKELTAEEFAAQTKKERAGQDQSLTLNLPFPRLTAAKQAAAAGKGKIEDHLVLLVHHAATQQWPHVLEQLEKCEAVAKGKSWPNWLRLFVLSISRQQEEMKQRLNQMAGELAAKPHVGEYVLASSLLDYGNSALETNEQLALLGTLRPVFERAPAYLERTKDFEDRRLSLLDNLGRNFDGEALRRDLAERYPRDYERQIQFARWLFGWGDDEAAYAWLAKTIANGDAKWEPDVLNYLHREYLDLLANQGRYADQLAYLAPIMAKNPDDDRFYTLQLIALFYTGRDAEAEKLIREWIAPKLDGNADPAAEHRAYAAVHIAMNEMHPFGSRRYDEAWHKPLGEFVLRNATVPRGNVLNTVRTVLQNSQFGESEEARRIGRELSRRLVAEAESLRPRQLEQLVEHVRNARHEMEDKEWEKIAATVQKRWEGEKNRRVKDLLDRILRNVHQETSSTARVAYLRLRVQKADAESRADLIRQLCDVLLDQPWSNDVAAESLALIPQLGSGDLAEERLMDQLAHLHKWTDKMIQNHYYHLDGNVEGREKLTRQQLDEKRKEMSQKVREDLSRRLTEAASQRKDELGKWMRLEALHLEVELKRNLTKVTEECWKLLEESLGQNDGRHNDGGQNDEDRERAADLRAMLHVAAQSRLVTMLSHLAIRKEAPAKDVERLLKVCEDQIQARDKNWNKDEEDGEDEDEVSHLDWRLVKFQLLVALDRPKELEIELKKWIAVGDSERRWQKSLAFVHAELGKLEEATKLLEALESAHELGPAEYRALAAWYQATKQDTKSAGAKIALYKTVDEHRLRQMLYNHGQGAREVVADDLLAFQAYFSKASYPQEGIYSLEVYYKSTHDFRLLTGLADAMIGHTSGQVYPLLGRLGSMLGEVQDEATVDEVVKRIAEVRKETKSAVDLRALDLLELLFERRAAQLQNQSEPHLNAALAALKRTDKPNWSPGEPVLFTEVLADISFTEQPALAAEQLRIVVTLHAAAPPGTLDRLKIADWISTIHWRHGRQEQAIDVLSAACDEFRTASQGKCTPELRTYLFNLVSRYEQREQFARGERVLLDEMPRGINPYEMRQLVLRLFDLYNSAVSEEGETSHGKGERLYRTVHNELLTVLEENQDQSYRPELHQRLCNLFRAAHRQKIAAARADLVAFVRKVFPQLAARQVTNYRQFNSTLADAVGEVLGPREMLALYIERIENEPRWLARQGDDGWYEYHSRLAQLREEVKDLGPLEPRLLAIVIAELKKDMRTHRYSSREMYHQSYSRVWKEKRDEFARAAEEVLAENRNSRVAIQYIADYLFSGLDLGDRAIEVLLEGQRRNLLDDSGKSLLVRILFHQKRHGEAIAILEPLIAAEPDVLKWRTLLMHAYFRTKQPQALLKLLAETDQKFHGENLKNDGVLAVLAESCLENELFEQSAQYFEEAIKVRTDALATRTFGDSTLARYFEQQASAYAGMKSTALAVDKASAAIVLWPPQHDQRRAALDRLRSVLAASADLNAYVADLDKEVAKSNEERPIVRKQIGIVYQERVEWDKAITQFKAAVEVIPNDADLHEKLIACYDAQGDQAGALAQTLDSLELSRRNLDLWARLVERFTSLEQEAEAERAATSLVEVVPNETEGHARLAEVRQSQNRWHEAISHWRQVARLRKLEPTGLLKLAPALLHEKRLADFDEAISELERTAWPERFDEELKKELPRLREERAKVKP